MLSEKLQKKFNEQINAEIFSAYLYQAMAAYFEATNLDGFATWMDVQAQEELAHARKFYDFINERGGRVILDSLEAPKSDWDSPLTAFEDAYKHEQKITAMINDLVDLAVDKKDHASFSFLQWFVDEQVEEEASVDEIIQKLKIVGESGNGLFMINRELGQRSMEDEDSSSE